MELEMRVAGEARSAAVELVHHMEASRHFQRAQLSQEQQGEGTSIVATVDAIYVPDVPDLVDNGGK